MTETKKKGFPNPFERIKHPFYRSLLSLAIPFALQNLITFAMGFTDNIMVGQLGDDAISGIYMGNQPQILLQMLIAGIEGAVMILAAQYWGKGDVASIKKVLSIGIKVAGVFGLISSAIAVAIPETIIAVFTPEPSIIAEGGTYLRIVGASYFFFSISQILIAAMRSVEIAKIGFYVSLVGYGLNIFLNYGMIFGHFGFPAMGVKGAAIATFISRMVELLLILYYVFKVDERLRLRLQDLVGFHPILLKDFIRFGLPIIGGNLVWAINNLAQGAIFGHLNSAGVIAAASIAGSLHSLIYVWMNGLSSAVGIITGKMIGGGSSLDDMKKYAWRVQRLFLGVGIVSGIITFFIANPFISLYNITPEAQMYSRQFLNVVSISIIGTCYQAACLFGLVKSGGDISFVFKNDTIFVFGVVLPAGLIALFLGAPPWVVFACLKIDQILKCVVAFFKINSFNWIKNLTRDIPSEESAEPAMDATAQE